MATARVFQDLLNQKPVSVTPLKEESPNRARLGSGMGDVKIAEQGKTAVWKVLFDQLKGKK